AMMNVTRYSASGPTHKSGMLAMSVVMWNVTPSIRLLGTNARSVHFAIRPHVGGGSAAGAGAPPAVGCFADAFPVVGGTPSGFMAARPQNTINPNSTRNPTAQNHVCAPCVMFGSMKIG